MGLPGVAHLSGVGSWRGPELWRRWQVPPPSRCSRPTTPLAGSTDKIEQRFADQQEPGW